jgi:aspartate racemase
MKHIGLVGNSAEGAALCYRTIVAESLDILGGFHHPEVTLHTFSLDDYMCNLIGDDIDWEAAGRVLIRSAEKLKSIGADFALCPDNTIHHGVDLIRDEIPLPYLHICEVGARYAQEQGFKKVLITGTRYTMRGSIYERAFDAVGIGYVTPDDEEVRKLDQIALQGGSRLRRCGTGVHRNPADRHTGDLGAALYRFDPTAGAQGHSDRSR